MPSHNTFYVKFERLFDNNSLKQWCQARNGFKKGALPLLCFLSIGLQRFERNRKVCVKRIESAYALCSPYDELCSS